jgi:hypothetical protein
MSASQLQLRRELGGSVGDHAAVGSILIASSIVFSFSAFALFVLQIAFAPERRLKDLEKNREEGKEKQKDGAGPNSNGVKDKDGVDEQQHATSNFDLLQTGVPILRTRNRRFAQRGNR